MCNVTLGGAFLQRKSNECVFVTFGIHHAMRTVIYSLSVSVLSHKQHDFQNKVTEHTMSVTRVRFLLVSSEFLINIILPAALWLQSRLIL